jgi:hypothetical protein
MISYSIQCTPLIYWYECKKLPLYFTWTVLFWEGRQSVESNFYRRHKSYYFYLHTSLVLNFVWDSFQFNKSYCPEGSLSCSQKPHTGTYQVPTLLSHLLKMNFNMTLGHGQSLASHRGGPSLIMWDLWWTKWRWGRVSPSTSVSLANFHSTNFSTITITYHQGLVQ